MHIVVNTDTEYEKKDANNHFGLKCQAIGYEWTSDPSEVSQPSTKPLSYMMALETHTLLKFIVRFNIS